MKNISFLALVWFCAVGMFTNPARAADSAELAALQGKWKCTGKNADGEKITQILEIKKDKFTFQMLSSGGEVSLYATGDIAVEKRGPFSVFIAKNIRGGSSADSLEDVDQEFAHVYQIYEGTLYVAAGFDKTRERPPRLDEYSKVTSSN